MSGYADALSQLSALSTIRCVTNDSARWPLLLARLLLRQGLSPDGRDYRLGDPRAGGGSKARPAVFAGDASWKGRKGQTNLRAVFRAGYSAGLQSQSPRPLQRNYWALPTNGIRSSVPSGLGLNAAP